LKNIVNVLPKYKKVFYRLSRTSWTERRIAEHYLISNQNVMFATVNRL